MAGLPLYLMAIPLRRSLAAGIGAFKRGRRSLHAAVGSATLPPDDSVIPERTEAESKHPAPKPLANATGFLEFARNDRVIYNNSNRVRSWESTMPTGTL